MTALALQDLETHVAALRAVMAIGGLNYAGEARLDELESELKKRRKVLRSGDAPVVEIFYPRDRTTVAPREAAELEGLRLAIKGAIEIWTAASEHSSNDPKVQAAFRLCAERLSCFLPHGWSPRP